MPFNTKYLMQEYKSDLGITLKNIPVKISTKATSLSEFYEERPSGVVCSGSQNFEPRKLQVIFTDGKTLLYPVPSFDVLKKMVKTLMPSIVDEITPGESEDEAVCINLIGEKWNSIPRSVGKPELDKWYKIPLTKNIPLETINYTYISDILGEIKLSTKLPKINIVEDLITSTDYAGVREISECQQKGLKKADDSQNKPNICSSQDIVVRKLIMGIAYENEQNNKGKTYSNRQAIVSSSGHKGLLGDLLEKYQPKDVAPEIQKCSRCIGYKGEEIRNLQLYVDKSILG